MRDAPVDDAFWQNTLGQAVSLRRALRLDEATDAYRLVHSEGDGLSGLIAGIALVVPNMAWAFGIGIAIDLLIRRMKIKV